MSSSLKIPIHLLFLLTPKRKALAQAQTYRTEYLALVKQAGADAGVPHNVPNMTGVDEDMRDWSLFQLLEHNTIVNRSITDLIWHLGKGMDPRDIPRIDPKRDVMPSPDAGEEQVEMFRASIQDFLDRTGELSDLRNTATYPHPMFGNFNAHQWTCMLPLHLKIHLRQARILAEKMKKPSLSIYPPH